MTSRAFIDLEKRSRAINRKRYLRIFIVLLIILIAGVLAYMEFIKSKKPIMKKQISVENKIETIKKPIVDVNTTKIKKPIVDMNVVSIKKPVIDVNRTKIIKQKVLKKEVDKTEKYNTVFLTPTIVIPKIKKPEIKSSRIEKKIDIPKAKKQLPIIKEKKKFNIIVKSLENEDSLLKKNQANENFETTLNLSKYYYKKSKFEKAILWSKKANHYKSSSFKPWLIYAKAKIKQNKKDEAIKAVETFLSYFNSDVAQKFLQNIKGKK